ncbi:uncharacterized protein SAPINGB_P001989 [Magnusiomyces paraingens]|uniref:NADH dehydrogenase [ubiquinone] 1 alpha subcomplex subunit n=1 Tax=Magnusiomyces paraingens TaxID=2606893 RepID=A0A5E8BC69_9ASCO|nr:uncharacterized protein SAPINGB_P001989 [Saprochaete ingens]VVT48866.1 unnamed protein product [Saprochaete ingens]
MSSSIFRVLRNVKRVGFKNALKQMNGIGDIKSGRLVGVDAYGNKFFENDTEDEIHMRTRWVEYKDYYGNMSTVEAGWHFWLGYGVDTPPNQTSEAHKTIRAYPEPPTLIHGTGSPGAYVPYNTVKPKIKSWEPVVEARK